MPKLFHEALVQLVRNAPDLIPDLLWPEDRARAPTPVRVEAAEFIDLNFAEHRADAVLTLGGAPGKPAEALVVEVQVEVDPRKRMTWPLYVAGLRTRLGCPVTLVVVAIDAEVARWCAAPIDLGRGRNVLHPWVLGPDAVPPITDVELARRAPELAVLSVAAHADEPGAEHIALTAMTVVRDLDDNRGTLYPDFVFALLGRVARAALEELMNNKYQYQNDIAQVWFADGEEKGLAQGLAEGIARGKADLLLKLLQLKGFAVGEAERARVLGCTDEATLETWAARVLVATSLAEVFAD